MSHAPSLSCEELDAQLGEQLPERDVLALLNVNAIIAANAAVAANALTVDSVAYAESFQAIFVSQQ